MAVSVVPVKSVGFATEPRHEQVEGTVVVVIGESCGLGGASGIANGTSDLDLFEIAITQAAEHHVPARNPSDEEIKMAVVVLIDPNSVGTNRRKILVHFLALKTASECLWGKVR